MNQFARIGATAGLGMVLLLGAGCAGGQQPSTTAPSSGSGQSESSSPSTGQADGATLAQEKCTECHSFDRVASAKKDKAGWESTIDRMERNGLQITSEERQAIVDYLVSK